MALNQAEGRWQSILAEAKAEAAQQADPAHHWSRMLCAAPPAEGLTGGLFASLRLDELGAKRHVPFWGLLHEGDAALASKWPTEFNRPLGSESAFRLIYLAAPFVVPADEIADERIAVCVPGAPSREELEAACECAACDLLRARLAALDEQAAAHLCEHASSAFAALQGHQQAAYQRGAIATPAGLPFDPRDVFEQPEERREAALAVPLLRHAYYELPTLIDPGAFRTDRPLSSDDLADLYYGYRDWPGATKAQKAAVGRFGAGLHLADPVRPQELTPHRAPLIQTIAERLAAGPVELQTLCCELTAPPRGLPGDLVALYLMLLVYQGAPTCCIELAPGHQLLTRAGQPFAETWLTSANVGQVAWVPGMYRHFLALRAVEGPDAAACAEWLRALLPDLSQRPSTEELRGCQPRLAAALDQLGRDVAQVRHLVAETLAPRLAAALPADDEELLAALAQLAPCAEPEAFAQRAAKLCEGDSGRLGNMLERLHVLKACGEVSAQVIDMRAFLDGVVLPVRRAELASTKLLLDRQLDFHSLIRNPQLVSSLRQQFLRFRQDYLAAYREHHQRVHTIHAALRKRVEMSAQKIDALRRLDTILPLRMPGGAAFHERREALLRATRVCQAEDAVLDQALAQCPQCGLTLADGPPTALVEGFEADLDQAFKQRCHYLGRLLTHQILTQERSDKLAGLHRVLQLSHLEEIPGLLTQELTDYLRDLLRES